MSDLIKEAFTKVKEDISLLKEQLSSIVSDLNNLKQSLSQQKSQPTNQPTQLPTEDPSQQTNNQVNPTHNLNELYKLPLNSLKRSNLVISTGNEGVPTNKPTNQQTNQHTGNEGVPTKISSIDHLERVSELLESLDSLKKEVRFKFKKLTEQEMMVFSAIYNLESKGFNVDYSLLSEHLKLTEISIRDYIHKLLAKGIPIQKTKENNKKIILSIHSDLKKIASLQAILTLRNL